MKNNTPRNQEKNFEIYKQKKEKNIIEDEKIKNISIRKKIRPLLRMILKIQRAFYNKKVTILNFNNESTDKPIIYVVTHIGKWDFEIINEQIKDNFYVIASDFLNMNGNINGFFMNANGVIFVDETSVEDRHNSKIILEKILDSRENIMIFPEGTWNLSPNKIIYYPHFGAASIALKKNALIMPIAVEQYNNDEFVINMGKMIDPNMINMQYNNKNYLELNEENNKDKLLKRKIILKLNEMIRDSLATLKYEIWESKGVEKRENINLNYWNNFIGERLKEWPGYSMEEQIINTCMSPDEQNYKKMLVEISKMKISDKNDFLFLDNEQFIKKYSKSK